jgi:hypothetical protein
MTDPERPWTEFDVDELVRRCKDVCLHDYPNPDRVGCPSDEVIERLAHEDQDLLRHDELIAHIVTCSPCFQKHVACRERLRSRNRLKIAALSTAAVLLLVFAVLTVRNLSVAPGQTGISKGGVPPRSPESKAQTENQARAQPDRATPAAKPNQWVLATLDLRELSGSRGEGEKELRIRDLARERLDLRVLLPVGSPSGPYEITLRDLAGQFSRTVTTNARVSAGETSAQAKFDLREAPTGPLRFGVRRPGADWAWIEVRVR